MLYYKRIDISEGISVKNLKNVLFVTTDIFR